jgi:predicted ABC-type ATPase
LELDPLLASLLSRRPLVVALAGPNGAGKSTFFDAFLRDIGLPFVNADVLARENRIGAYAAAAMADTIRRELVRQQQSFVFETVFSDPAQEKLAFLRQLEQAGYTAVLCFIGTSAAAISEERVAMRVSQGGHDVPNEKLFERYPRILNNLEASLQTLSFVWIFDNSDLERPYRLVAKVAAGQKSVLRHPLPEWLEDIWNRSLLD